MAEFMKHVFPMFPSPSVPGSILGPLAREPKGLIEMAGLRVLLSDLMRSVDVDDDDCILSKKFVDGPKSLLAC